MPLIKFRSGSNVSVYCPIPVNGVFFTLGSDNPSAEWPGTTWVKLTGGLVALAGTAGYAAAGSAGGSKKISVAQMPSHTHIPYYDGTEPAMGDANDDTPSRQYTVGGGNLWTSAAVQGTSKRLLNTSTGGGKTTTPCTSPSALGGAPRSPFGGAPCLESSSEAARPSSPTARTASATFCCLCRALTRATSSPEQPGRSTRRTGSPSAQVRPTLSELPEALLPSRSRQSRCRAIPMSYRGTIPSCSSTLDWLRSRAYRTNTSTTRREGRLPELPEGAAPTRTVRRTSLSTSGGARRSAGVVA